MTSQVVSLSLQNSLLPFKLWRHNSEHVTHCSKSIISPQYSLVLTLLSRVLCPIQPVVLLYFLPAMYTVPLLQPSGPTCFSLFPGLLTLSPIWGMPIAIAVPYHFLHLEPHTSLKIHLFNCHKAPYLLFLPGSNICPFWIYFNFFCTSPISDSTLLKLAFKLLGRRVYTSFECYVLTTVT